MGKTYRFDDYVAEAQVEPFRLDSGDGIIEISAPLSEVVMQMDYTTSPRRILQLLCGEAYSEVYALVAKQPSPVLTKLLGDLMSHFGAEPPPGGFGASST